ncbi:hypothetical protein [Alloactinosynnema sp. L-07]|uniref:hypothetical protein n=1 Tax=Alloactinosynnema sp. L-07 TaxID=1653480 RepID=UPI00065F0812|nr:hypothetical protein [Alloactinosynnema sp. L-07]CRK61026.1 hypothetical protein [Alloactinosynnema sp. L-07]
MTEPFNTVRNELLVTKWEVKEPDFGAYPVREPAEWARWWSTRREPSPLPEIDWTRDMLVIAVVMMPDDGHRPVITALTRNESTMDVNVAVKSVHAEVWCAESLAWHVVATRRTDDQLNLVVLPK